MTPLANLADISSQRYRRFSLKYFWQPQGPLIRVYKVSLNASLHGIGLLYDASACCTAGPGSNLGSAPLEEALYRADAMRKTRVVLYE
jgi:hypothetical protein